MSLIFPRHLLATLAPVGAVVALVAGCSSGAPAQVEAGEEASESGMEVVGETVHLGSEGEGVTIGLTYVPSVQFAPVYVAGADEIFRAAGIGASIRHHGADEGLFTALASGEEDVTIATGDEVLQARDSGLDIVAIGAYYHEYPVVIITPEDSGITTVEGLKGKSVGLPGEYGSNWFGLLAALDAAGMSVDDIDVVSIGFTQAASLASGAVDAVVGFINSDAVQLKEMGVPINIIELDPADVPLVGATIVSTTDWVERHPELASGVVGAITAGAERVIQNPQHALEVSSHWDKSLSDSEVRATASEMLKATIPLWMGPDGKADATQDLETWEAMAPFLAGVLDMDFTEQMVEESVTNDYTN